jgi:signal peptidase I
MGNENIKEFTVKKEVQHYRWFKFKELLEWLRILVLSFCFVYILNTFIIINANVPTGSMIPTIVPGEKIIANRLAYVGNNSPQMGDIIIFHYPDNEEILFTKRVIGVPGDKVMIQDGQVYINGIKLVEPYITNKTEGTYGPYEVPEDHYFVLGDNRNNSEDSRFWTNKYVRKDKILGKVMIKYSFNKPHIGKVK